MIRLIRPWPWLVLGVVLLAWGPAQAEPMPLKELDQETIQARARHYLRQPGNQARLKPILDLVRLDAQQIFYGARRGAPPILVWVYDPKTALTALQRTLVECSLEGALADVLGHYRGGLLSRDESRALLGLARLCDATQPVPADLLRSAGPPPIVASLLNLVTTCFFCCDCCCDCCFSCGWSCCCDWCCGCCGCWDWSCCGCWPGYCWGGYPCWPYYYGAYYVTPGAVYFAYPGYCALPAASGSSGGQSGSGSLDRSTEQGQRQEVTTVQAGPRPLDRVERNFSVVRRRLLLKFNTEPVQAPTLYTRAVRAYGSHDYQEADDLAWAALQLNDRDARFWYVKALSERALSEHESALASAQHGAALELIGKRNVLRNMEQIAGQDRQYLHEATVGLTTEEARRLVGEPVVALSK